MLFGRLALAGSGQPNTHDVHYVIKNTFRPCVMLEKFQNAEIKTFVEGNAGQKSKQQVSRIFEIPRKAFAYHFCVLEQQEAKFSIIIAKCRKCLVEFLLGPQHIAFA